MSSHLQYAEVPGHGQALCVGRFIPEQRFFAVFSYRTHTHWVVDRTGVKPPQEVDDPSGILSSRAIAAAQEANRAEASAKRHKDFPAGARVAWSGDQEQAEGRVAEAGEIAPDGFMPEDLCVPVVWDDGQDNGWYAPSTLTKIS